MRRDYPHPTFSNRGVRDSIGGWVLDSVFEPRGRRLLDGDGLGQVARLVDVEPAPFCDRIGQLLQRYDRQRRLQLRLRPWKVQHVRRQLLAARVALGGDGDNKRTKNAKLIDVRQK